MDLKLGARRSRRGAHSGFSLDGGREWEEVRNVWMREWVSASKKQGSKYQACEYDEWRPAERAESCCFKRSSRRKFLRLPKQQQDVVSTWVIENMLSKSRPVFVISSAGELLCYDMERHSPTWVNCSFRYRFDGRPRSLTLKLNGIPVEFALPKSAELAIRECFRHDGINHCWCDTVSVNVVYMVTGDQELTKPMLYSMGESYMRAPTCVLETALRDDLYYTRSWTIQECLLSQPLQNPRQCYCQLSQRTRRIRVDLTELSTPDVVVPVIKSMIQRVSASGILHQTDDPFAALSIIQALGFIDTIPSAVSQKNYHQMFVPCTVVLARELNRSPKGYDYLRWKHSYGSLQSAQVCALLLSEQELAQTECQCTMIGGIATGPWLTSALERMTLSTFHNHRSQPEPFPAFVARRMRARQGLQGIQELVMSLVLDVVYLPFAALGLLLESFSRLFVPKDSAPKLSLLDFPARVVVSLGVLLGSAIVHLDVSAFVIPADPKSPPIRIRSPFMSILGVGMVTVPTLLAGTGEEAGEESRIFLVARILSVAFYCLSWTDETAEGTTSTIVAALVLYQSEHVGLPDTRISIPYFFVAATGISIILALLAPFWRASVYWGKMQLVGGFLVTVSSLLCVLSVNLGTAERGAACDERFTTTEHKDTCPPPLQLMLCWAVPMAVTALWSLKRRAEKRNWTLPARLLAWLFSLATTLLLLLSAHPRSKVCDLSASAGSSDASSNLEESFCTFAVVHPQRLFITTISALGAVVVVVVIPACYGFVAARLRKRKEVLPKNSSGPDNVKNSNTGAKLGRKNTMAVRMPVVGDCTHKPKKEMLKILEKCGGGLTFGKDPEVLVNFNEAVHGIVAALRERKRSHKEAFERMDENGNGQLTIGDLNRGLVDLDLIVDKDTIRDLHRSMRLGSVEPTTEADREHRKTSLGAGPEADSVTPNTVPWTVDQSAWLRLLGAADVDPNPVPGAPVAAPPPQRRTLRRRSLTEPNLRATNLGPKSGSRRRLLEIEELDGSFRIKKEREKKKDTAEEEGGEGTEKQKVDDDEREAREEEALQNRPGAVVEKRAGYKPSAAAASLPGVQVDCGPGPTATEPPVDLDIAPSRSQWQPPRAESGSPRHQTSLAGMEPLPPQGSIPVNLFRANSGKFKLKPLPGTSSAGRSDAGEGSGPAETQRESLQRQRRSSLTDMAPLPLPWG